jgi:beta-1,4-mannosyltransferase
MMEKSMARFSFCDFTVSDAMNNYLIKESYSRHCLTLYDRPPTHFQPLSEAQKRKFLERFEPSVVKDRQNTKLIVSSTSWTLDEDFSIFLDALVVYSNEASKLESNLPSIVAVITGKGPLKDYYLVKILQLKQEKRLKNVVIRTEWLSNEDYALLLGSADLGVSLHKSSSGLDLPMKVVDMFGTGLPVAGYQYEAISELIEDGVNGRLFSDSKDLAAQLVELFQGGGSNLQVLRKGAMKENRYRWDDEWDDVAGRVFRFNTRETTLERRG